MGLEIRDAEVEFLEEGGEAWVCGCRGGGCGGYDFPAGPGCVDLGSRRECYHLVRFRLELELELILALALATISSLSVFAREYVRGTGCIYV